MTSTIFPKRRGARRSKATAAAFGLALGLPLGANAEQPNRPIDSIVVTATRSESDVRAVPIGVSVINRESIENSLATDLSDLLRFQSGFDVASNGGAGQAASVFIRGAESNHTLVLVDGVRINPGTVGGAAVQNIAPHLIERIEIVKGPRSALWGNEAIGGVINIITRKPGGSMFDLRAGGGSDETRSLKLATGLSRETREFGIAFDWFETDGIPTLNTTTEDRGFENLSTHVFARQSIGPGDLTLTHWQAGGKTEYTDFLGSPVSQDFINRATSIALSTRVSSRWTSLLTLSSVTDEIQQNELADFFPAGSPKDFVETNRRAIDWLNTIGDAGPHTLIAGLSFSQDDSEALSFGAPLNARTGTAAAYLEYQFLGGGHQLVLAARQTRHEDFGEQPTWNIDYGFRISAHWRLRVGIGTAFRAPDATDRFGFGGDPELDPELARQWQAAVDFTPNSTHSVALEIYDNDIDELIEFDFQSFRLRNIERARIRGAELSHRYNTELWSLTSAINLQRAENPGSGERLLRRSERSFRFNVMRRLGRHSLALDVLGNGERLDFGGIRLAGYVLSTLTGKYQINETMALRIKIENVLDSDYETVAGYNSRGRNAMLEFAYTSR